MEVIYVVLTLGFLPGISWSLSESLESYLERYGYLGSPVNGKERSDEEIRHGLILFQSRYNLQKTGTETSETSALMKLPRCGFKDLEDETSNLLRYSVFGDKWLNNFLTYGYLNYSADMSEADTRQAIEQALRVWSDVTALEFTEVNMVSNAQIQILFQAGEHGDGFPFDGPGGVLAHAFSPGAGYGGDAHFDEAENFTINGEPGIDLFLVAAHEFGHSLGLNHSTDASALMYPYYQGYIPNFQLSQDDIDGIQSIYGPNPSTSSASITQTTTTQETMLEENEPCLCIRLKPES